MFVKFEPSGTHIKDGILKIRLDVFPEVGDKTYAIHHIQVPDLTGQTYTGKLDVLGNPTSPVAYQKWLDGLPKKWQLNPCLCHFITVDSTVTLTELIVKVQSLFDGTTKTSIDDILSKENSITQISEAMRTKTNIASKLAGNPNIPTLINTINTRFASLQVKI